MAMQMLNTFQRLDHPVLPKATQDEAARQKFTKSFKQFIQAGLLPGLGPIDQTRVAPAFERTQGRKPKDRRDIRVGMVRDPYFRHHAAANRVAQELLWESTNISIDRQFWARSNPDMPQPKQPKVFCCFFSKKQIFLE